MQADDAPAAEAAPKVDAQGNATGEPKPEAAAAPKVDAQANATGDSKPEAAAAGTPAAAPKADAAEEFVPEVEAKRIMDKIPGKFKPSPAEAIQYEQKLTALAKVWKEERLNQEFEDNKYLGFTRRAEILNARTAMFFFATGVFTEQVTDQNMPEQIRTLLDVFSIGL